MEDRVLIGQALVSYTRQGWEVVSVTGAGFQLKKPHYVSAGSAALFVALPVACGFFAALISVAWAAALFSLAVACGVALALNHLTVPPQLLFITVDHLRNPAPPQIVESAGLTLCSMCHSPVRSDAKSCHRCNAQFQQPAAATA